MKVDLHIERMILEGLPIERRDRAVVEKVVQSELARLIGEGGLKPAITSGGATPFVKGGNMLLTNSIHPKNIGRQIANAVYGGIGK
jgi:hypothetical protein